MAHAPPVPEMNRPTRSRGRAMLSCSDTLTASIGMKEKVSVTRGKADANTPNSPTISSFSPICPLATLSSHSIMSTRATLGKVGEEIWLCEMPRGPPSDNSTLAPFPGSASAHVSRSAPQCYLDVGPSINNA